MSLKDKLMQDLKESMKNKDTLRKDIIQIVRAGVLQIEKDEQITLDDDGVLQVIIKEAKKKNDVYPDYEKSGRTDLLEELKRQQSILNEYLPEQFTDDELNNIVKETIVELGVSSMKDMGYVMMTLEPKTSGKADGKRVSTAVKAILS
ncbi:MAG: GatB/YqeY domain-containing protein [Lachnospirales bacterium]